MFLQTHNYSPENFPYLSIETQMHIQIKEYNRKLATSYMMY